MDTRFAFTLARLLVGGYVFGACVLVADAQAQQQQVVPPPPPPAAPPPVSNPPSPNGTAPQPPPVSPAAPSAAPSSVTSPVNEPRSAARTHERTSVAKTVHHRGRSIVAARTPAYYWRSYWDPSGALLLFCPVWNYPYDPDRCQWRWVGGLSGP